MKFETSYQNTETQIRFRDLDTDEAWFDKIGDIVIVTVPPDDPRSKQWRAVQLSADDVTALVEFLEVEAPKAPRENSVAERDRARDAEASPHRYLSTACLHDTHPSCRATCKFCDAPCICTCHGTKP